MKRVRISGLLAATAFVAVALVLAAHRSEIAGQAGVALWLALAGCWGLAAVAVADLSSIPTRASKLAAPLILGLLLLVSWETITVGAGVPPILLPSPSSVGARIAGSLSILSADFVQTFVRSALPGYAFGCLGGFAFGVLCDRAPFLRRGLLPIASFSSAMPIVGIAPIMVMWFGFDWPSKAATVAAMTFFPMLVGTSAGLAVTGAIERDLMRTYAAGYVTTLAKLRLPMALPFIFDGLKVNATLALIGAIVAEFFGTPIVGIGFRISLEAARMSLDMVWAEIALASLAGSLFYGAILVVERATTGWHPATRSS